MGAAAPEGTRRGGPMETEAVARSRQLQQTAAPELAAPDYADTSQLGEAIGRILPALESFNRFEGSDPAARLREAWHRHLDQPLPSQGAGLDQALAELAEVVIPHGLRNG